MVPVVVVGEVLDVVVTVVPVVVSAVVPVVSGCVVTFFVVMDVVDWVVPVVVVGVVPVVVVTDVSEGFLSCGSICYCLGYRLLGVRWNCRMSGSGCRCWRGSRCRGHGCSSRCFGC